jgi:hypothetical protein
MTTRSLSSTGFLIGARDAGNPIFPVVESPRIMCVGDSITDGQLFPGDGGGFLVRLSDALAAITPVFVGPYTSSGIAHAGYPGDRLDQIETRVGAQVTTHSPDVVVLIGGLNDARAGASGATMSTRLAAILATVYAAKPNTRVVVGQIPWVSPTATISASILTYNGLVPATLAGSGAGLAGLGRVVDLRGCSPSLSVRDVADSVPHPSRLAFRRYADALYPAVLNASGRPAIW